MRSRGRRNAAFFRLPQFWRDDSDPESLGRYQERLFRRVGAIPDVSGPKTPVFASEDFEWAMCGGTRMYTLEGHRGPADVLAKVLNSVCPRYYEVCGGRWPPVELLKEQQFCFDFAFLAGVWRYSRALGSSFPCGLPDAWPPPGTYVPWGMDL